MIAQLTWKQTKDKDDYRGSVNKDLWTAIQQQFKPYNPDGLTAVVTTDETVYLTKFMCYSSVNLMYSGAREQFLCPVIVFS